MHSIISIASNGRLCATYPILPLFCQWYIHGPPLLTQLCVAPPLLPETQPWSHACKKWPLRSMCLYAAACRGRDMARNAGRRACRTAEAPSRCSPSWRHCNHPCGLPHLDDGRYPLRLQTGKPSLLLSVHVPHPGIANCQSGRHSNHFFSFIMCAIPSA